MKIFAIRDESDKDEKNLAYLFCYERENRFYIELPDDADPWETPMLLASVLKKGEHTVNAYWSKIWVQQRIVPQDRQNIGRILRENGLKEYSEYKLLIANRGRCSQDSCYLVPIEEKDLPEMYVERQIYKVEDAVPLSENRLMVLFRDGSIRICCVDKVASEKNGMSRILSSEELFSLVSVQIGGYGVSWGEDVNIMDRELYENSQLIPLQEKDFKDYIRYSTVNVAEAAEILNCSRQYIDQLTREGKLHPVKKSQKSTLYLKRELTERKWH